MALLAMNMLMTLMATSNLEIQDKVRNCRQIRNFDRCDRLISEEISPGIKIPILMILLTDH